MAFVIDRAERDAGAAGQTGAGEKQQYENFHIVLCVILCAPMVENSRTCGLASGQSLRARPQPRAEWIPRLPISTPRPPLTMLGEEQGSEASSDGHTRRFLDRSRRDRRLERGPCRHCSLRRQGSQIPGPKFLGPKFLGPKFLGPKFLGPKFLGAEFPGAKFTDPRLTPGLTED
jgi:hypothetical protein